MKTLFPSKAEPVITMEEERPVPGPNSREVGVLSYDPDAGLLCFTMPNDVQAFVKFDELDDEGTSFEILLNDSKIGPQVKLQMRNVRLPKFASPEEAEAWLEAHS